MTTELQINSKKLILTKGDITLEDTNAIANAANTGLKGGGGVDGAIHRAGGPKIMEECLKIGTCPTGEAVITTAGSLSADYVIHTAGPVYNGGKKGEAEKLRACYSNCLKLAAGKNIISISFPSISTGVYRYPLDEAAPVALNAVVDFLRLKSSLEMIKFVLFDDKTYDAYSLAMQKLKEKLS
ncbi:MAG: macro domain-containing protein [Planctomycetota bacterium]|jgi:O-acetyl-ADP-ribose deacetylase (regulator of RNase III)